ncbi:MAG: ribonuclease III [Lachnospiraceae bacterium]|nr:ribonuclease III [Lachnospiraceae bacterium]
MTEAEQENIRALEEKIGYRFKNQELITQALTHSSYANERKIHKIPDYERIEFLGDAVLELVSSEFLYLTYPQKPEGELTKTRASMVCEQALAFCAKDLDLGRHIRFGKGEAMAGGAHRASITSDVMEAIIGAIFLDSGIEDAKQFIHRFILSDLEEKQLFYDAKTILQERIQKSGEDVRYELLREEGPEHDKRFYTAVYRGEVLLGEGSGRNKKESEQQAAYQALVSMKKAGK